MNTATQLTSNLRLLVWHLQQHPGVERCCGSMVVVIEEEHMVFPTIKPLDTEVELGKESGGVLGE